MTTQRGFITQFGNLLGQAFANLPAGVTGDIACIVDALPGLQPGDPIFGGSSNGVYLAWFNGANWQVIGTPATIQGPVSLPGGRLSVVSGNPVLTNTTTGVGTIYYSQYLSTMCPIWNVTENKFTMHDMGGTVFQALSDTTKSPAAAVANKNYDIFAWMDGTTFRISRGPPWTSDTARGTGAGTTQLVNISGILTNFVNITNGPAAFTGTYLGTIRTNGSALLDWNLGGAASGGTAASLGVYNYFNRVTVGVEVKDTSATYTYTSSTIRQANASAGNQISFVMGVIEDALDFSYNPQLETTNVANAFQEVGMGLDTTTAFTSTTMFNITTSANNAVQYGALRYILLGGAFGWHFVSANEKSDNSNANGFNHTSASCLSAVLRM